MMQRTPHRQAVLAHQPDPLAAWPGQLRGHGAYLFELTIVDFAEQPHRAVKVADIMHDQVEAGGRPRLGQLSRRRGPRGAGLLSDLDDDAVRVTRAQECLLPPRY